MKKVLFYIVLWLAIFLSAMVLCIYDAPVWAFLLAIGFTGLLWALLGFCFKQEFHQWLHKGKYENDLYTDDNVGLSGENFKFESTYSKGFEDCYSIAMDAEFQRAFDFLYTPEQLELPDLTQTK